MNAFQSGTLLAVLAALLFGVTTPLIKRVGGSVGPLTTAGLLYLGAAFGAALVRASRRRSVVSGRPLARKDLTTIVGMALCGAALAPVLLVLGLARTDAATASLALNAETFFTVLLAVLFYREPWRGRVLVAMVAMVLGGVLLALDSGATRDSGAGLVGLGLVVLATLFWGVDNTLSRSVSEVSSLTVVALKGLIGATLTFSLGAALGEALPTPPAAIGLVLLGASGYGASLVVYLLAQRRLGAARTGSIFGLAPFIGATLALLLGDFAGGWGTLVGAALFLVGVWLHAREQHDHAHEHAAETHEHVHRHDDGHHDHRHEPPVPGAHCHAHSHDTLAHRHDHAPDIHHRHAH